MNTLKIELIQSDITMLEVDAIVNAANQTLLGGGGVDGAIHRAAGPQLLAACKQLNGCNTGEAKITKGYNLPASFVIHTVGPVWRGGEYGEANLLRMCYVNSMKLAEENDCSSLAFPNISTGVYGYPKNEAAAIAIEAVKNFDTNHLSKLIFVCFDKENYDIYNRLLTDLSM